MSERFLLIIVVLLISRFISWALAGLLLLAKLVGEKVAALVSNITAFLCIVWFMSLARSSPDEPLPVFPLLAYGGSFILWALVDWLIATRTEWKPARASKMR